MSLIEITTVQIAALEPELVGRSLDLPKAGSRLDVEGIDLEGWAVGQEPLAAIEVRAGDHFRRRLSVGAPRPDVGAYLENVPGADRSGFNGTISLRGVLCDELTVHAVLRDRRTIPLATVAFRPYWRVPEDPAERDVVSVVIPCFNQAHFLHDAIESALAQTHPRMELVVIDDGSTDNTQAVAERYPNVRLVRQENRGLAEARNSGIRHSSGEFLIFLDADDRLLPHAAAAGVRVLRDYPAAAFAAGEYHDIGVDGAVMRAWAPYARSNDPYAELLRGYHIGPPASALYRREVLSRLGAFDPKMNPCEDYELYLRIAREYPVRFHPAVVAEYRRYGASMSGRPRKMLAAALSALRRQEAWARKRKEWRAACAAGMAFFTDYYRGIS